MNIDEVITMDELKDMLTKETNNLAELLKIEFKKKTRNLIIT